MTNESTVNLIATWIAERGGCAVVVGGAVRDMVMAGRDDIDYASVKDLDIEVFGITLPTLKDVLDDHGVEWDEVGEQFSVLKAHPKGMTIPLDLSIPRYERSTGDGHREFEVMANPELTFKEAARRRDFTMNAMGRGILSGELFDPYQGKIDIQLGLVFHVSEAFDEDPLRPLRAARFAARFGFKIPSPTMDVCRRMTMLSNSLPQERIWMEIEKAVHECIDLGDFFSWINDMQWLHLFPEIRAIKYVNQDPEWHPEGDVFEHTRHALNYWSRNLRTGNKEDDLVTAMAILCHDFGKVTNTQYNEKPGHVTSYGHEEAGAEPTRTFLHRLRQYELAKQVVPLVENHLFPVFGTNSPRAIRRLSTKVDRLDLLANVSRADQAGRPPKDPSEGFAKIEKFVEAYASLDIPRGGPKRLVGGDYLIGLGLAPGPTFKTVLDAVYELQLDGSITTKHDAEIQASIELIDLRYREQKNCAVS